MFLYAIELHILQAYFISLFHFVIIIFYPCTGEGKRRFENLKKRFSKKRNHYKKVTRSGSGGREARVAEDELKKYGFMNWLCPFMRMRETTSNLLVDDENMEFEREKFVTDENENPNEVSDDNDDDDDDDSLIQSDQMSAKSSSPALLRTSTPSASKNKVVKKSKNSKIPDYELETLNKITKALEPTTEDSDDLFGKMIASELKLLPPGKKRRVKHEINNIIFNYQEQEDDQSKSNLNPAFFQNPMLNNIMGLNYQQSIHHLQKSNNSFEQPKDPYQPSKVI